MHAFNFLADRRQFITALAAGAALPAAAFAKPADTDTTAINTLIGRLVAQKQAPNVVVAIGGHGRPAQFTSAGQLQLGAGPLAGPDTLYRINSMTKPITAFAIMALIEDGRLSLATPLSDVFPAYAHMHVLIEPENGLGTRPATKPILIRHLLTHTAGFAYDFSAPAPLKVLYGAEDLAVWKRVPPEAAPQAPSSLIAYANAAANLPLMSEPGAKWNYSIALDIAGAVVEAVSGLPFEAFLQQRLFAPLGMKDSFFTVPADRLDRFTANYLHHDDGLHLFETAKDSPYRIKTNTPSGGGGLVSSPRDYARFMAMLLGEGQVGDIRVLKPALARLMMSNLLDPGVTSSTGFYGETGFGGGGRSSLIDAPGGEGFGTYGWIGSSNTVAWVDRKNGVYVTAMTQVRNWWPNPIRCDLSEVFYQGLAQG